MNKNICKRYWLKILAVLSMTVAVIVPISANAQYEYIPSVWVTNGCDPWTTVPPGAMVSTGTNVYYNGGYPGSSTESANVSYYEWTDSNGNVLASGSGSSAVGISFNVPNTEGVYYVNLSGVANDGLSFSTSLAFNVQIPPTPAFFATSATSLETSPANPTVTLSAQLGAINANGDLVSVMPDEMVYVYVDGPSTGVPSTDLPWTAADGTVSITFGAMVPGTYTVTFEEQATGQFLTTSYTVNVSQYSFTLSGGGHIPDNTESVNIGVSILSWDDMNGQSSLMTRAASDVYVNLWIFDANGVLVAELYNAITTDSSGGGSYSFTIPRDEYNQPLSSSYTVSANATGGAGFDINPGLYGNFEIILDAP